MKLSKRMHEYGEHAAQDIEVDAWFEYAREASQLEAENERLRDAAQIFMDASKYMTNHAAWRGLHDALKEASDEN